MRFASFRVIGMGIDRSVNSDSVKFEVNVLQKFSRLSRICFHGRLMASRNFHGRRPAYINRGRLSQRLTGLICNTLIFGFLYINIFKYRYIFTVTVQHFKVKGKCMILHGGVSKTARLHCKPTAVFITIQWLSANCRKNVTTDKL